MGVRVINTDYLKSMLRDRDLLRPTGIIFAEKARQTSKSNVAILAQTTSEDGCDSISFRLFGLHHDHPRGSSSSWCCSWLAGSGLADVSRELVYSLLPS